MTNELKAFKRSLLYYLKNTQGYGRKNLVDAAEALFKKAITDFGSTADQYTPYMYEQIQSAVHGIKLDTTQGKNLDNLIRDLGNSDSIEESLAFHALNIAYNFINPKKTCLKETICNLLRLHDKLAKEEISISNKNFYGSFFLTTSDVEKIRAKKEVIDELLNSTTEKIFTTSPAVWPKDFPVSLTIDQNIRLIEQHISTLSEKQCEQILSLLLRQIEPILEAKATPSETTFCEKRNSDKRNALHVHALNDRWFFDFLTKLVQTIKNALGVKTSAELVLEHVVDETKQLGIK